MNEILSASFEDSSAARPERSKQIEWFDITAQDCKRVAALADLVEVNIDAIISDFFARSGGFENAGSHRADEERLSDIGQEQRVHFLALFREDFAERVAADRDGTGSFNARADVSTLFYMGMFAYVLDRIAALIRTHVTDPSEAQSTILSLFKLASCQKAVTLDASAQTRERRIADRERELSELPTPVLKLRDGLLLVPVVGTLDSYRARELTVQMLDAIRDMGASAVVLDITGVQAVDSAVANNLVQTMAAARLMGAQSVLTGITAEVAQSLVKIGVTGNGLNPAGDLQRGIETAERLLQV